MLKHSTRLEPTSLEIQTLSKYVCSGSNNIDVLLISHRLES